MEPRQIALIFLAVIMAGHLSNCGSESAGPCSQDADCSVGYCVDGECVDCRTEDDCPSGSFCQDGACLEKTEECQGDATCNNHGVCDDSSGVISCTCDVKYTGDRCDECAEGYQDYGDGACRPSDPCADDVDCADQNRVCDNDQGSAVCGDCIAGYHPEGESCAEDQFCIDTTCSGHGSCDDTGGMIVCTCDPGYDGDNCEACAEGFVLWPEDSDVCVDDPCEPDPCDVENGVPGSCTQADVEEVLCECLEGHSWTGSDCQADVDCTDSDQDGCGVGADCSCSDCDDSDPDVYQDAPELCDDKDNDCDLSTDEDYPDLGLDCDGDDGDLCENGTWTCTTDGSGVECINESAEDIQEACNGEDDDCDGQTDEEFPELDQACDGPDSDLCENGTWTCTPDGSGLECVNESTEDLLDVCDGEDNDCDGASPDGSEDPLLNTACDGPDTDLCPEGLYTGCSGGALTCSDNTSHDLDVCDGVDNDCDPQSVDGSEDPQDNLPCDGLDSDLCIEGVMLCNDGTLECSDTTTSTLDTCDGLDDDCDPASPDGSEDPLLNTPCDGTDTDLCPEGLYTGCSGGALVCSDNTASEYDICDGVDNDCDPLSPDGSEDSGVGVPCDGPDSDLCAEGTSLCSDGSLECSDTSDDTLDTCNGVNDDCNAATADGSQDPLLGTACDGADTDLCLEGVYTGCSGGALVCSDNTASEYDVCDGFDNDCDPLSPDGSEDSGVGVPCDGPDSDLCAEGTSLCSDGSLECSDTSDDTLDTCNGLNDDCNAATADGSQDPFLGTACDGPDSDLCVEGVYSGCSGGTLICSDNTGDNLDTCNSSDDDCDPTSPDGSEDPLLNTPCDGPDSDLCTEGLFDGCSGGSLTCDDTTGDTLEICFDSIDNDCDTLIDEGCGCLPTEWECDVGLCCEGTGCCGTSCQTKHNNNQLGDEGDRDPFWFDCVSSGTYNLAQAMAACAQFTGDVTKCVDTGMACDSDLDSILDTSAVCGNFPDANQDCACWGYQGPGAGHTYNETAPSDKNACFCPLVGDPMWN